MKKTLFVLLMAMLLAGGAGAVTVAAQNREEVKAHFKPYGFIRSYAFVDSRQNKALSEDMFYFIPRDREEVNGQDINRVASFNYQAITTRLGLDILGYRIGNTAIDGKIEGDFYCLNSSGNIGLFRMRQAYIRLYWDDVNYSLTDLDLLIGQTWHPMAADMPHGINLETGAPFNPFNRSAQLMFRAKFMDGRLTATGGFLEQLQYRSSGPDGSSNKYQRYALLPEIYVGVDYRHQGLTAKAGLDLLTIKPRYGYTAASASYNGGERIKDRLWTVSPFLYLEYRAESFQLRAKTVYAQGGEHLQLLTGYALTEADAPDKYKYSPFQQSVSFVSAQVGKTVQGMMMLGYVRNFGTIDPLMEAGESQRLFGKAPEDLVYISANGYLNICRMLRLTPTVVYNLGRLQLGCEYGLTGVQYGDGEALNIYGVPKQGLHWVWNHRLLCMVKFNL